MNKIKAFVFVAMLAPVAFAATVIAVNAPKKTDFKFSDEPIKTAAAVARVIELPPIEVKGTLSQPAPIKLAPKAKAKEAPQKTCKLQVLRGEPQSMVLVCDIERTANDHLTTLQNAPTG